MNKKINYYIYFSFLIISLIISYIFYLFLISSNANITLRIFLPIISFIFIFLGLYLIYKVSLIYLLHKKGIKGYKLRGKLTFLFLIIIFITIFLIGGAMFYLIYLIEINFIEKERIIITNIIDSYKKIIDYNKLQIENELYNNLNKNINKYEIIFIINKNEIKVLKLKNSKIFEIIKNNINNINNYFKDKNNKIYYIGDIPSIIILEKNNTFYATYLPSYLTESLTKLNKFILESNQINFLKKYIHPVTILSIIFLSFPIFIIAIFISYFIARNITRNIEEIVKAANIISLGNLDYQVEIKSNDEMKDLANNFNIMAHKLKIATQQIKRIERLEAWKSMTEKLAHEIKNPLTPIKLNAERLLYSYDFKQNDFEDILKKSTQIIINETKRLENLVNEFSKFSRLPYPKFEDKNITNTLKELIEFYKTTYPEFKFDIDLPKKEIIISYDEDQIKQALINIINNSIEASANTEKYVKVSLKETSISIIISIQDKGQGIPIEIKDKIFNPYFTTKPKGIGLGLAIAERIILDHNGYIWFETKEDGTYFFIELTKQKWDKNNEI